MSYKILKAKYIHENNFFLSKNKGGPSSEKDYTM
jgi:hypothetical protein